MGFVSAGAYGREIDLSLYAETQTNTSYALVGTFNKGPIGTPTLTTNINRLVEIYGEPISSLLGSGIPCQGWFAAREYLRQGNKLYINRVESSAVPATYARMSLPAATDQSITTGTDGVTGLPAAKQMTSAGVNFVTQGVVVGDVLEIADVGTPADNGFYVITVVAAGAVDVNRNWPTGSLNALTFTVWVAKRESKADGATSVSPSARILTSATASFVTNCSIGNIVRIHDTTPATLGDNGVYRIASITSATQIVLDRDFPKGNLATLEYTVYGTMSRGTDGGTATPNEFVSATAQFTLHHVQAGDILWIHDLVDTGNNGYYYISGIKPGFTATTLLVDTTATWPGGALATLDYDVIAGSVAMKGLTKGTWCKGMYIQAQRNAGDPTNFNLEVRDSTNLIVLETVYNMDLSSVAATMLSSSAYFGATVLTTRSEPVIGWQMVIAGGDDGYTTISDADFIGNAFSGTGLQGFKNKETYEIDIVSVPGQVSQNVEDALVLFAETRMDCIALIDPPDWTTIDAVQEILDFHNGTNIRVTALNSSYAAMYWPWVKVYDEYNDVDVWTSPSGHLAGVFTQSDNMQYPWFAPAGLRRGKLKGAKDLRYSPDQGDRDALNGPGANVNPITNFIGYGIHAYGQKTLQKATTALDRVNVRRMLLYLERTLLKVSRQLAFDPNDEVLWREFKQLVDPVFQHVLTNRGIREYLVVCDATTTTDTEIEQNKMIGKLYIKPQKTAEIIELQFILTSQTANFTELTY